MQPSVDIELSKYWVLLSAEQKQSLLQVIKSFITDQEKISIQQYNQELAEVEAEYQNGNHITSDEMLKLIRQWQYIS
ncbi:MAG: hypothetical protein KBF82_08765 [Chitinophagaceae bacterium]|nr:hypothetical protein [Chitinophagaceae bacterium]MBP9103939.1 hypothetical protein [Chitinophagaceae bacterium]